MRRIDGTSDTQRAARRVRTDRRASSAPARRAPRGRRDGGDGRTRKLEERTVAELRRMAADRDIPGRSRMRKAELVRALRR